MISLEEFEIIFILVILERFPYNFSVITLREALKFKTYLSQVSCGEGFTLCRTVDGRLYSWGRGKCGVLGQGDEQNRNIPSLVTSLPFTDIVHIDAGHSYAAAVREY